MNNVIPFPVKSPLPETLWQAQAQMTFRNNQYEITGSWHMTVMPTINKVPGA